MNKKASISSRHAAIQSLIQQYAIEDQHSLMELLTTHFNIRVNQAIVSRDLRVLGAVKVPKDGKSVYELPDKNIHLEILNLGIKDIQHNDYLVVIKTLPGLADFVGDFLDALEDQNILGNIAGENTVFVTPAAGVNMKDFYKDICLATHFRK